MNMKGNLKGMKWNMKANERKWKDNWSQNESKWYEMIGNERNMEVNKKKHTGPIICITGFHWILYYVCFVLMSRLYGHYKSI